MLVAVPTAVQSSSVRSSEQSTLNRSERSSRIGFAGRWLAGWPRPALVALTFVLLAGVGLVDYFTGYELSVLSFYLLPVSLAAWFVGRRFAIIVSFLSVAVWIVGDVGAGATYSSNGVLAWNATIILGFFLVVASLLDSLRRVLSELESRVRQRTAALTEEMAERDRLEKEVLEISEREQRRIGHDLHDGLGQHLTATALASQVLGNHLAARQLSPETGEAERIVELLEQSIELTRSLARGLSPVAVETEGLSFALAELADATTAQFYLPCELQCPRTLPEIDLPTAMHLYRIAQESISNAVRHGRASRVDLQVTIDQTTRWLTLAIVDNGKGLPPRNARRPGGQGLRIMTHRARMIGATLEVAPGSGGGTVVRCVLDLPPAGAAASLEA